MIGHRRFSLIVYDKNDPHAPGKDVPDTAFWSFKVPDGVGTLDPRYGRVGDRVAVIDRETGQTIAMYRVIEKVDE